MLLGDKEPTLEQIRECDRYLLDLWSEAHTKFRKNDTFMQLTYPVWEDPEIAANRASYRTPRAPGIVEHATDAISSMNQKVHRQPAGGGEKHEQAANRLERGVSAVMRDAMLLEAIAHPGRLAAKYLSGYGYAVLFSAGLDLAHMKEEPERKSGESASDFKKRVDDYESSMYGWNPVRIRAPHPSSVLLDPTERTPNEAIVHRKMRVKDIQDAIIKRKNYKGAQTKGYDRGRPYDIVDATEIWTPAYHMLMVDDDIVISEPNPWGYQPYTHGFSGRGGEYTAQEMLNPKDLAKSFLDDVEGALVHEAQQESAKHETLIRAAYAKRGFRGDASEAAEMSKGDWMSGDEADFWVEKLPQLPAQIFQLGEETGQSIEEGSFSLQAAGIRQTGVDTATQQVILSEATGRTFKPIIQTLNHMFSVSASNILRLATRVEEEYGIDSLSIGDDELNAGDIFNNYRIEVTHEAIDPVVQQQQVAEAVQLYSAGLVDKEYVWRVMRVEDTDTLQKGILTDKLEALPPVLVTALAALAKEQGLDDVATKLEQQSAMLMSGAMQQAGGQPQQQGVPGVQAQ